MCLITGITWLMPFNLALKFLIGQSESHSIIYLLILYILRPLPLFFGSFEQCSFALSHHHENFTVSFIEEKTKQWENTVGLYMTRNGNNNNIQILKRDADHPNLFASGGVCGQQLLTLILKKFRFLLAGTS